MDNIDKYFHNAIDKINKWCANHKYRDAIEFIEQELNSSYIPLRFVQTLEQLYLDINKQSMIYDIKQKFNKMSKTEMLGNIYKQNKLDLNVLSFFLSKFLKEIDQYDLQFINKIFIDEKLSNNEKIFILSQLKIAQINYQFSFINNITNETFVINPLSNFEINYQPYYCDVTKQIENALMKEPSLILLAKDLLEIIFEHFFNRDPINYDTNTLATNITNYVKKHFDPSTQTDKSFELWITNIMKNKKVIN